MEFNNIHSDINKQSEAMEPNSAEGTKESIQGRDESKKQEICDFYKEGKCRFNDNCFNLHVGDIKQKIRGIPTKGISKDFLTEESENLQKNNKRPPLRTAGDVRNRILWDSALPQEYFTIGYQDRFEGIVEKPFSAFSWKDLADAELDELAIPQHRIKYFKYKDRTVWDKEIRLDNVFGSDGGKTTIDQVIPEVDEEAKLLMESFVLEDEDSEDEDDGVIINDSSKQMQSIKSNVQENYDRKMEARATHFLCIRIKNEDLAEEVMHVQKSIIKCDPVLRSCAMPSEILHVTLAMVKCETDETIELISNLLSDFEIEIKKFESYENENKLIANGLSTFGSRVLYSKLEVPPLFSKVVDYLSKELKKLEGVTITNHFDFVPHMTLMKVNRSVARERRSKYIDSSLYNPFIKKRFGEIIFDNIYFCDINDYRGPDGFYLTCKKIEF